MFRQSLPLAVPSSSSAIVVPYITILDDDGEDYTQIIRDDDGEMDQQIRREVGTIIDLTDEDDQPQLQPHASPVPRPSLANPLKSHRHIQYNGFSVDIGSYVEVSSIPDSCRAQFLKVTAIVTLPHGGYILHGLPFTRTRRLNGQLPRKLNEVCLIIDSTRDDPRTEEEQSIVAVPLEQIIKLRDLECTNADYPAYKYHLAAGQRTQDHIQAAEESGLLICRWKYKRVWASAQARRAGKFPELFALHRCKVLPVIYRPPPCRICALAYGSGRCCKRQIPWI